MIRRVWRYLSGKSEGVPSNEQVALLLVVILGVYHTMLLALYVCSGMTILAVVNVISVLIYAGCTIAAKRGAEAISIHRVSDVEVVLQVLIAGTLLGDKCGFQMYLIALICHAFYTGYIYRDNDKINAMHYVVVDVGAFILLRVLNVKIPPLYAFASEKTVRALYTANFFTAIIVIEVSMSTLLAQIVQLEARLLQKNRDLEELSRTDPLTGLANRRSVEQKYAGVMQRSGVYTVILGDIDDFKKVNDTYGHDVGDIVLQEVARIFESCVRSDDMVCRWGGEEILVFLPSCKKSGAGLTANRILEKIRAEKIVTHEENEISVSMTFGIADSGEGEDLRSVIQKADARLYYGKVHGKNCIVSEEI